MQLISINISSIQQIVHKDKTIGTGIFKQPTQQAVYVGALNLLGDEQADLVNHGGVDKAVYGFSANHYAYWQQELAIETIPFGKFGENLTISDLDENTLCIGDRLHIGDVVLEVTQPRVPCFKLGITFNMPFMPRKFTEKALTGIYFRVIQTATISAGENITVVEQEVNRVSVCNLFRAYFDRTMPIQNKREILTTANKVNALSDEWRKKVIQKLVQLA